MSSSTNMQNARHDLSRRSTQSEWLDHADASPEELALVLRDLARFNGAMLGHRPVLAWLRGATRDIPKETPLTLVDVGCGYGDLLRAIRRWARRYGVRIRLIGIDLSRATIDIARAATDEADEIDYLVADVFAFDPPFPIDFVVSSLLTHHMTNDMIVRFLRWSEQIGRKGWIIYDLQRHPVPLHFIGLMGKVTRLHPMVIHDGRISVARSLTRAEWHARIREAGLVEGSVRVRWFMFRFAIGRVK